jgi:hypothetical protein
MFEKDVMRLIKALAGTPGADWTTAIKLFACCVVRPAARVDAGTARMPRASTALRMYFFMRINMVW